MELLDTHLDLLDTYITSKNFVCLQDVFKTDVFKICLQGVFQTCLQDVFKTRRLEDVFSVAIFRLPRRLQDVLREVLKMSSRRLQDALEDVKLLR